MESKDINLPGKNALVGLLLVFCVLNLAASYRILMVPTSVGSHLMQMNSIAEGLLARGHDVYTILNSRTEIAKGLLNASINILEYDSGKEPIFQGKEYQDLMLSAELLNLNFMDSFNNLLASFDLIHEECRGTLGDNRLYEKIEAVKFDFAIVDGIMRCYYLIPHKFGIPFASFMSFLPLDIPHAALQGSLILPGALDLMLTGDNMPRLFSTLGKFLFIGKIGKIFDVYDDISNVPLSELQKQAKLWLYDITKVLDTPMPLSPYVINVGGLNVRKTKPLPNGELRQFVDSATDGFILVSFGCFAKYFPADIVDKLLDTFKAVTMKIVWKWDKKLLNPDQVVPKNILIVNWLPQNDLLGHKNIKLFVNHCGNSGQHEALYSNVPMVGFPLFGDQMFNCKRVEGRFGRHIRAKDLTKDKLLHLINHVISEKKYVENIKKASAIFRDQPMEPRETAAYWVDHVIKYGADHLLSKTNDMSWFQILMWDVLFVICAVAFVVFSVLFLLCRCLYRRCCRKTFGDKIKQH